MESWTFLIQKEGDTVWLPLDVPESEILEGRYRVMGKTNHVDCLVAIQVSYLDVEAFPPQHRVQKRQARTNRKGLVALLPFTHLRSGVWDIRCQYQLIEDQLTEGQSLESLLAETPQAKSGGDRQSSCIRRHALQIQVVPQEIEADIEAVLPDAASIANDMASPTVESPNQTSVDYMADSTTSSAANSVADSAADNEMEAILAAADQIADHVIATMKTRFQADPQDRAIHPVSTTPVSITPATNVPSSSDTPSLALTLSQSAYVVSAETSLTLTGQIVGKEHNLMPIQRLDDLNLGLQVQLIQPQTGDRVLYEQVALTVQSLPTAFTVPISIPTNLDTHLLMGELTLFYQPNPSIVSQSSQDVAPNGSATAANIKVLARHSFTVTMALTTLLNSLKPSASHSEGQSGTPANTPLSPPQWSEHESQLQLPEPTTAPSLVPQERSPRVYNPLPPKLSQLSSADANLSDLPPVAQASPTASKSSLDLPSFLTTEGDRTPSPLAIAISQAMAAAQPSPKGSSDPSAHSTENFAPEPQAIPDEEGDRLPNNSLEESETPKDHRSDGITQANLDGDETYAAHSEAADSEAADSGAVDSGAADSEAADSEAVDSGAVDSGAVDSGAVDSGAVDSGAVDSGAVDSGAVDLGAVDSDTNLDQDAQDAQDAMMANPFGELTWDAVETPDPSVPVATTLSDSVSAITDDTATAITDVEPTHPETADEKTENTATISTGTTNPENAPLPESSRTLRLSQMRGIAPAANPSSPPEPSQLSAQPEEMRSPQSATDISNVAISSPLPHHVSIPTPAIHLPHQELVAGHSTRLTVTLSLPTLDETSSNSIGKMVGMNQPPPLIFVKLWVQDRQTRSILDGPRWLVDFIRNHEGDLEAMTQLVLPIGCMEVSVEAIAVELPTQRESNKVTIYRTVVPTALPSQLASFSLDDLN